MAKNNYGPASAELALTFDAAAGIFTGDPTASTGGIVESIRDQSERDAILRAIRASANAGIYVPAAMTGQRTAYHVLSAGGELPPTLRGGKPAMRRFWRHVEQLRAMRMIDEPSIRRSDRHLVRHFVLTPEDTRAIGQ